MINVENYTLYDYVALTCACGMLQYVVSKYMLYIMYTCCTYMYTHQGSPVGVQVSYPDLWYKLGQSHHQEIQVQEKLKLLKQNL